MGRAKSWKFIGFNPVPDAELPPPKKSPAIALDIEPAMNLLHHSETISLSVNAAIALGMLCGLRRSEIVGLRWNDWDKEKQRLYIRHGLTRRSSDGLVPENYEYCAPAGKSFLVLDRVKTEASENYIEAKGYINDILAQLELRYNVNKMKFGPAFKDLNFIMCEECGFPRDPRYIFYAVSKTIATYNETHEDQLPYLRAHDLRHTAATLLLESNVDVKYVSRQLRHSSTTITRDLYQHVTDKMLSETADVMDNLVRPKKVATHVATHKA
jgi:integrase